MRYLFVAILFALATVLGIHAQSTDTIKVVLPTLPVILKDSLRPSYKTVNPVISNFRKNEDMKNHFYTNESPMTFELDRIPRKKNIFNSSYSKFIIPTAMISYGIMAQGSERLKELDYSTHHEITEHYTARIRLDDYMQFAPAVAVYGLDFCGIKAKHNFRDRTIVMATSFLIMCATVQTMKSTINIARPDGSNNNSFPSGHTATAFVDAHILFKEYRDTSPWIGVAGYTVAATTGTLRVINKKHWVSDVVSGAGIGILSAELGYLLLPVFHNTFGIKDKKSSLVIAPTIGVDNYGVGLAYTF